MSLPGSRTAGSSSRTTSVPLADALVEAVNDDTARKARANHARQQVRGAFSWRALAGCFDALYAEVLDRTS
jgi:glycosyltransferase involved in cell wall biosynthesis